jgi:hypothetical protein
MKALSFQSLSLNCVVAAATISLVDNPLSIIASIWLCRERLIRDAMVAVSKHLFVALWEISRRLAVIWKTWFGGCISALLPSVAPYGIP